MKRLAIAILLTGLLVGCAGTSFDWSQVRQIKQGMTEAEVVAIMGAPYLVKSTADGLVWVWSYAGSFSGVRTVSVVLRDGKVAAAPVIPESFK